MTGDGTHDPALDVRRTGRFGIVQAAVIARTDLSPMAKLVYTGLTLYAGGTGQAWPSPATLADTLGVDRATVYRRLDELEAAGVIRRQRRRTGTGADRPTVVTIIDEGVSHRATGSVAQSDGSVAQSDTTSVAPCDTNKEQRTRARPASPAPSERTPTPPHFDANAHYRRLAETAQVDVAHHAAAARRALAQGRQP